MHKSSFRCLGFIVVLKIAFEKKQLLGKYTVVVVPRENVSFFLVWMLNFAKNCFTSKTACTQKFTLSCSNLFFFFYPFLKLLCKLLISKRQKLLINLEFYWWENGIPNQSLMIEIDIFFFFFCHEVIDNLIGCD